MENDRCFETAVETLTGRACPTLTGADWLDQLQKHLAQFGVRAMMLQLDKRVIVTRRLENGKVHAEVMHPTLITILEKTS